MTLQITSEEHCKAAGKPHHLFCLYSMRHRAVAGMAVNVPAWHHVQVYHSCSSAPLVHRLKVASLQLMLVDNWSPTTIILCADCQAPLRGMQRSNMQASNWS